jgi:hypothetical protein
LRPEEVYQRLGISYKYNVLTWLLIVDLPTAEGAIEMLVSKEIDVIHLTLTSTTTNIVNRT